MTKINHESGVLHVTGKAIYIDDISTDNQTLHGLVYYSPHAHAKIKSFNLQKAKALHGVVSILNYEDIPGDNQMGPIIHDEAALATEKVFFVGQAVFLIAAKTEAIARTARNLIEVEYEVLTPILTIEQAIANNSMHLQPRKMVCGDVDKAFKECKHLIDGRLETGAQEHWYLETQIALCVPGENRDMKIYCSTQNPTETQAIVAEVMGVSKKEIEVETRRLGGGFGGKETQANHVAVWAAILSYNTKCPVKIRLLRDDDQKMTGKRHPFLINYKAGYDENGKIQAMRVNLNSNGGATLDLSNAILERAMLHADNAYFVPNMEINACTWKTNLPSNTAYRGFGGPQGMAGIEIVIDRIAHNLKKDSAEIRKINFYKTDTNNITPYGQIIENNRLQALWYKILSLADYKNRKNTIDEFNSKSEYVKRGIALTPVKFGISFTATFLNQAGALVNIYTDGSVLVNHGGIEMGQGLYTKMSQIASMELGINIKNIKVNATNTSKVPNSSPTAASAGTDLNGMAVKNAIEKLKARIAKVVATDFNSDTTKETLVKNLTFEADTIFDTINPERKISFAEAVAKTHFNQVSLSATGFYRTPEIHFDRTTETGRPFYYFAYSMAVTEVELDTLTGYLQQTRTDILHDVGESLNPNIDIGQIEGGYIQGLGWVTSEDCKWDVKGNLLNHSPDTYKIPGIRDIPKVFNISLLDGVPNIGTIRRSKAVGEPPFMLALSAWMAIRYAVSAVRNHKVCPELGVPATNENILLAINLLNKNKP